jgi:DNA polymerase-3 subunit beta
MDLVIERDALFKGLQMVQNIVEPRQTLPILANVLLETDGEALRLTATDLEVGARVSVPARVTDKGAVTVSARKLGEIVKELPGAPVSLKTQENSGVTLRCAGVTYKLFGLGPEDFPPVVPASSPGWLTLDAKMLREMLVQTSFAIASDETRQYLNGVLVVVQGKEAKLVATDGHRLALAVRAIDASAGDFSGIVPKKAVGEMMRVLGAGEEVRFAITENQFVLHMHNFVLTARLIEGQFPNYEAVIPRSHPGKLTISRQAFAAALRRVGVMAEERNKPVKLALGPGALRLSAVTHDLGEAEETLDVEHAGAEVAIGFNSRYLLDAMGPVDGEQVVLEFKDGLSPGVIKSVESDAYCCVIMPMRI